MNILEHLNDMGYIKKILAYTFGSICYAFYITELCIPNWSSRESKVFLSGL